MRIWRMMDPENFRFAHASLRGNWTSSAGICPECTASQQKRAKPLVMEWEPDSEVIGDFVWPGFDAMVVTEFVLKVLQSCFKGFEASPVEMVQSPKLKKPTRITQRIKPRVWLPYKGPPLHELWIITWVHMDPERSTARVLTQCKACGSRKYELHGIERQVTEWDKTKGELLRRRIPRTPGQGLFVREKDLTGSDLFQLYEFPSWYLCTDRVKDLIEGKAFTNITFHEMGDVISS